VLRGPRRAFLTLRRGRCAGTQFTRTGFLMRSVVSWIDVKLGLRMLVKHPGLSLVGGLGMAVATALSVGFFTFVTAHVFPTLPLHDGHRIVALENRDIEANDEDRRALHDFFAWRGELTRVEDLAAFRRVTRNLTFGSGAPEAVQVADMTAAGFRVARVQPLLGRYLLDEDEAPGAAPVVVIGYDVWQQRFGGGSDVLGRDVGLDGVPHTIAGVMPKGFAFPENDEWWTTLRVDRSTLAPREGPGIFIFGRLAPGATLEQAQAELTGVGTRAAAAQPATHELLRPMVMPYVHSLSDVQGITLAEVAQMQMMMTLLLLIVAINVSILVYARTAARYREIAVRTALGASRRRVVGQLFVEALVLSVGASLLGLALAQVGIDLAHQIMLDEMAAGEPFWLDYGLRPVTVLFTIGLAVLTALIVGVAPGLKATGRHIHPELHQVGAAGLTLGRTWTLLVVAQVAIAVAALPSAVGLGWQALERAASQALYPADEFLVAELAAEPAAEPAGARSPAFGVQLGDVMQRLQAEPTVAAVTYRAALPDRGNIVRIDGLPSPPYSPAGHRVYTEGVATDFLDVFGSRILIGRGFVSGDAGEAGSAVVVTEAFVRQVLGGGEAVGRYIRHVGAEEAATGIMPAGARWYQVVGVAADIQVNRVNADLVPPVVMYPVAPEQTRHAHLAVRLRATTPHDFAPRLRQHVFAVNPELRLSDVRTLADRDRQQQAATRLIGLAVALVLATVLLLSAAGVYAMMSFTVTQRRREIGIRSAIGAHPRTILFSVFGKAAAQIGAGVALGAVAAAVLDWSMRGGMTGGHGLLIVPALAAIMLVVGLLAALGPARRGLRIEPTEALRADG
jgi:putative ABC transport system permease protein